MFDHFPRCVTGTRANASRTGHNPAVDTRGFTTIYRRLQMAGAVSNLAGAIDTFIFTVLLLPVHVAGLDRGRLVAINAIAFAIYMPFTLIVGWRVVRAEIRRMHAWLGPGRT